MQVSRRTLWFSLVCSTFIALPAALAQAEEGWKTLFDGKSIDDWQVKSGFATYQVEDGAIVGTTAVNSPNTFLCTKDQYGDFELTFEVKLDNNELNSGVQIRSQLRGEDHGGRVNGPQVEIEASPGQSGYIYGEALKGWMSAEPQQKNQGRSQLNAFKNGEWNHYRVVAIGPRIQTWVNGVPRADVTDEEVFKTHAKGLIGLQVHGVGDRGPYQVRWRNIKIKELPTE